MIRKSEIYSQSKEIHPHGMWMGESITDEHETDYLLAHALAEFFRRDGAKSVVDFGCGIGEYVHVLRNYRIECEGYDGHPDTVRLSEGVAHVLDLSQIVDLGKKFDWVLSLEVGEHLPKIYEKIFIENLHRHSIQGIVLSWAIQGQGGFGHFNEQNNDYVKETLSSYGYRNDLEAEEQLQKQASLPWFKNTLMVFRRLQD